MHFVNSLITACSITLVLASSLENHEKCNDVHFITARGTYQPIPDNQDTKFVSAVCDQIRKKGGKTCGYEDIQYPADYAMTEKYCPDSVTPGVQAAFKQINGFAKKCPKSKIVLSGYSQGAEVLGDVLAGPGGTGCQPGTAALCPESQAGKNIAAVVLFADPWRTPGQSYNFGSAGKDIKGYFLRDEQQLKKLASYKHRIASYCATGDQACAGGSGGSDPNVHPVEVETHLEAAKRFVLTKV